MFTPYRFRKGIRAPKDFPLVQRIQDISRLGKVRPDTILCVQMQGIDPRITADAGFIQAMGQLVNLELLTLRNCGIRYVSQWRCFPRLKQVDFCNNQIDDVDTLCHFASGSPSLARINVLGNPVTAQRHWQGQLPEPGTEGWRLVALCTWLEMLNGADLSTKHHADAVSWCGSELDAGRYEQRVWDEIVSHRCVCVVCVFCHQLWSKRHILTKGTCVSLSLCCVRPME
jgi:hypothetical protein